MVIAFINPVHDTCAHRNHILNFWQVSWPSITQRLWPCWIQSWESCAHLRQAYSRFAGCVFSVLKLLLWLGVDSNANILHHLGHVLINMACFNASHQIKFIRECATCRSCVVCSSYANPPWAVFGPAGNIGLEKVCKASANPPETIQIQKDDVSFGRAGVHIFRDLQVMYDNGTREDIARTDVICRGHDVSVVRGVPVWVGGFYLEIQWRVQGALKGQKWRQSSVQLFRQATPSVSHHETTSNASGLLVLAHTLFLHTLQTVGVNCWRQWLELLTPLWYGACRWV